MVPTEFTLLVDMTGCLDHIYPYLDGLDIYIDNVLQPASAYDFMTTAIFSST